MPDINVISTGTHGRGETWFDREITRTMYEAAMKNGGRLTESDACSILTDSERWGYGASASNVLIYNGKYYAHCHKYNCCD